MVRGDGPSALRDYGGAGHIFILADLLDGVDHVIGVFSERIVGAGGRGRVGAVIVHRKAATYIEVLDIGHLARLGIDPGRFVHGILDGSDIRDLRADVEVDHLQAVCDTSLFQYLHQLQSLAGGEAELGRFTS